MHEKNQLRNRAGLGGNEELPRRGTACIKNKREKKQQRTCLFEKKKKKSPLVDSGTMASGTDVPEGAQRPTLDGGKGRG